MESVLTNIKSHLKNYFGFDEFRIHQEDIVHAMMRGQDVLAILPTGSGKSLCYQLPAIAKRGTAIVVSPLIALMEDQVQSLNVLGVRSTYLNSQLSRSEQAEVYRDFNTYDLVYVAPERIFMEGFFDFLRQNPPSFFIIDEAHCISQWGHAFRPEYRQLAALREKFPDIPIAAFTATATDRVQKDISDQLSLQNPHQVLGSFDRDNLTIRIMPRDNAKNQLLHFLKNHPNQAGIIYTTTRKSVDKFHEFLSSKGYSVGKYHAGLPDTQRRSAQDAFLKDNCSIMVATIAFGMGVHKPDVRFIVHMDLPKSFEGYYQEIGRAGRDGMPADCLLLYSTQDYLLQKKMSDESDDLAIKTSMLRRLEQFFAFCHSTTCRRKEILHYFGETYSKASCDKCDNCLDDVITEDATITAQKILSCIYRMRERFGLIAVIDVLSGSDTQSIRNNRFDQLSTYGILKNLTKLEIRHYIFSLINQNYIILTDGEYPILKLTEASWKILKSLETVFINRRIITEKIKKQKLFPSGATNESLLTVLKTLRKKLADHAGIPPFMIFHDKHLHHMAALKPTTEDEFRQVQGVGALKLKQYAKPFLESIILFEREKSHV